MGRPVTNRLREPLEGKGLTLGDLRRTLQSVLLATLLLACIPATPVRAEEIHVLAAASLTDALEKVAAEWQKATGHAVVFNLGASNDLARQIRVGAPADVFFSADETQMEGLIKDGLVNAADRVSLLSNTLVVVVPQSSAARIASAADLASVKRLALADFQGVPAGVYAKAWLESAGVWSRVEPQVVPALNVRAALAAVESENADAGVVYKTDAFVSKRVKVAFEVARADGPAIVYPVARVKTSTRPAAAAFVAHLQTAPARAVFQRFGFLVLGDR